MVRAISVCLLTAAALACGSSSEGKGDGGSDAGASDADPGGSRDAADGPPGGGGLRFEFVANPPLARVTAEITVDQLTIELRDVRAIGDSAPGDGRTSIPELSLDFRTAQEPPPLAFPLAPPGIYSSLQARFGGSGSQRGRLEIRGHVLVAGRDRSFRIENDEVMGAIGVDLQGLMVAAQARTAVISVSLVFLGSVRWAEVEGDDEELGIEHDDPQMPAIVAGMAAAFSLAGTR